MEIRKPKKSQGVPKQKRSGTLLQEIKDTFIHPYGSKYLKDLNNSIENSGFWDASLSEQMVILSRLFFDSVDDPKHLLKILKNSDSEHLKGCAPSIVYLLYSNNPGKCCSELRSVGKLDGTWPQEDAQVMLSQLAIKYGVNSILSITESWLNDPDERVRRLLVEGFRPRGVWKEHIKELKNDPKPLKPILKKAIGDDSLYVRKAAANNINDISKDNPDIVISWTKTWLKRSNKKQKWSIKQGLRGLLRDNNKDALALLGFNQTDSLQVNWKGKLDKTVKINTIIPLRFSVRNSGDSALNLKIQMLLTAPGKGNRLRTKTFILATLTLKEKESRIISKNFHFVDYNSTPRLPGKYTMMVSCNGNEIKKKSFIYSG